MRLVRLAGVLGFIFALAPAAPARADNPDKLTIAIFAPSLEFTSAGRLKYLNQVAAAIEAKTGIPTTARSFVKYSDLTGTKPDFAIVEAQCIAARSPGKVLATATVDGASATDWGLYARAKGQSLMDLRGKKVSYVKTGCRDSEFLDFAMLHGVFRHDRFFASALAKPDAAGAVVGARDVGDADAVVVPARVATGMSLLVRIESVPNPGLVAMNDKLDATLIASAKAAVMGTAANPISGWTDAASYDSLAGRMAPRKKAMVLIEPTPVDVSEPGAIRVPAPPPRAAPATRLLWSPPPKRPRT